MKHGPINIRYLYSLFISKCSCAPSDKSAHNVDYMYNIDYVSGTSS